MTFEKYTIDNVLIAKVCISRLDIQTTEQFRADAKSLFSAERVVLNLESVEFIDSTGLGALLSLLRNLKSHEGELRLTGVGAQVLSIFRLVRMNKVFEIYSTVEEALPSFSNEPRQNYQMPRITIKEDTELNGSSGLIEEVT